MTEQQYKSFTARLDEVERQLAQLHYAQREADAESERQSLQERQAWKQFVRIEHGHD